MLVMSTLLLLLLVMMVLVAVVVCRLRPGEITVRPAVSCRDTSCCCRAICLGLGVRMGANATAIYRSWRCGGAVPIGGRNRLRVLVHLGSGACKEPRWVVKDRFGRSPRPDCRIDAVSGHQRVVILGQNLAK